jgi:general secretion pathway protein D
MKLSFLQVRRKLLLMLFIGVLAGCVSGHALHEEGLTLLDEGKTTEGLAKLQQAVKAEPDNARFRASLARNREQIINRLIVAGNNERIAGHADAARTAYLKVLEIDPTSARAHEGLEALEMDKRHEAIIANARALVKKGDLDAASDALRPVFLENPNQAEAAALQRQIDELRDKERAAGPSLTEKFKKPVTLEFRDANVKMVFEALSRTSGINVLLDKDVRPDLRTSISVKDASVEDTIDLIMLQNQLDKKILNDNTVFVYPKTAEKYKEYQDLKVRSFHLTNADPKQILAMIKALLKTKDIFIHEKTNSIVMRDTPEAIRLAEKMIADQDIPDPEVMLEVEVLEVSRNRLSQLGINWPNQLTFTATGQNAATATTPTVNDLRQINGSRIVTSPALGVTLNLMLQDSDTNILASPRIRARNREKAKIMIGDRVPVITNAVTPVSTGTPVVTGNVQYLDVGLKLEVEPDIHLDREVAIKVNMEVSSIVKEIPNTISGTLAYQIGTRNASTLLQLRDGETQILAGLIDNEDRATANKVPGLGQLPVLGRLFSSHGDNRTKTEIVLSITPHIVGRSRAPDARDTEYWSGTEATLRDTQLLLKPMAASPSAGLAAAHPLPNVPAFAPAAIPAMPSGVSTPAVSPVGAPAATSPMVLMWQGPSRARIGDKINLTLNTAYAQGVSNLGLQMNFDPKVFKVVDVEEGNLLKQGNGQSNFTKSIDQAGGQIAVGVASAGAGGAPGGTGSVVTVTLEATAAAPQSKITLSKITPSDAAGKERPYGAPAPYQIAVSP